MATCKICGQPVTVAPVYCPECQEGADMAPVVRCKDCKWWKHPGCAVYIVDDSDRPHENDFCSFGERRDDYAAQKEKPHAGPD